MRPAEESDELEDDPQLDRLLARLDHPVPDVSAREIMARARARRGFRLSWVAAMVLSFAAAGVAYAAPGSPLPGWLEAVGRRLGFASDPVRYAPESPYPAGIAVTPGDTLVIRIAATDGGVAGYARIVLSDEREVVVESPSPSTRFTTEPTVLLVEHRTSDTLRAAIPRSSPYVQIEVAGRVVLLKEGPVLTTDIVADSSAAYLVPLAP